MEDRFKFRYWATKHKPTMIYAGENKDCEGSLTDLIQDDNWKVMQCTGLKDKNGELIYEGDIIIRNSYPFYSDGRNNYRGEVCINEKGLGSFYEMHCINPKLGGIACGSELDEDDDGKFEIIGNIYENPELIEN